MDPTPARLAAIEARFAGKGYGDLKQAVAEAVIEALAPLQQRYRELSEDSTALDLILKAGGEREVRLSLASGSG